MKEWPLSPTLQYIKPCQKRIQIQDKRHVCEIISDQIGHPIAVYPIMCAQCMMFGQPNMSFIEMQIKRNFMALLNNLPIGFYNTNQVDEIIRKVYKIIENDNKNLKFLIKILEACVESGALPLSSAEIIVKDLPKLEEQI